MRPMKTVRFHTYGDPNVLRYEDVADPEPGPGLPASPLAPAPSDTGFRWEA